MENTKVRAAGTSSAVFYAAFGSPGEVRLGITVLGTFVFPSWGGIRIEMESFAPT